MPNDFLTLTALTAELNETLSGGKIEKIYQPERDEITLLIHSKGKKHTLVISASAQNPRIHLSNQKKENPISAPTFCMHLRKHIGSGIIEMVSLRDCDRIIDISIISKNELKDTVNFHLICEMMGRYSNILLINEKIVITDALKQVSFDTATKRCILPSMKYGSPEQNKILPNDYDSIQKCFKNFSGGSLAKYISASISGLAPISSEEIVYRSDLKDKELLNDQDIDKLIVNIKLMYNAYDSPNYSPQILQDEKGQAIDYFIMPYLSLSNKFIACNSLCQAIESCVQKKDTDERQKERTKYLAVALKKYRNRNEKKLQKAKEKLIDCDKMETLKKYGELITSNLYLIKKGSDSVSVTDYYDENMPELNIILNPLISPNQNAQDYFKRYNKLKRTLAVIKPQIEEAQNCLEYVESIDSSLKTSTTAADLLQIEEELGAIGAIKKIKNKNNKHIKPANPIMYEYNDFIICVGKNNIQNDKLTFKTANTGDLWFHTKNYHGSHAIVFAEGREIPENVIQFACEVTAFYSKGSASDKIDVDYTFRKNVKRSPSNNLGMVIYTNQKTAGVTPCEHKENKKN